jgi:hypothetical protein
MAGDSDGDVPRFVRDRLMERRRKAEEIDFYARALGLSDEERVRDWDEFLGLTAERLAEVKRRIKEARNRRKR